jgi:SagB-type dehydrogenase family enzyme
VKEVGLRRITEKSSARRKTRAKPLRFRRTVPLVGYWLDDRLVFQNYALQTGVVTEPLACSILHFCAEWRTLEQICTFLKEYTAVSVLKNLKLLCKNGVLERSDQTTDRRVKQLEAWSNWNPAAGFFHFSTKDAEFPLDPLADLNQFAARTKNNHMPLPVKTYPRARKTPLPHVTGEGEFPSLLTNRRTWRMYGKDAVPLGALAEILHLTFGIQGWVDVPGLGRAAMKTSPSCGCLHPIEAYVLALRVKGLRSGFYHYNAQRHELEWLREGITRKALEKNIGNQWWFANGAFLIAMTAVFSRTRWKYQFPRVYRGILLEAGHLCQTFCLTATWKGLAPFSTIAYQDTLWEKWLGIDGINESVLYIAGAGTRPADLKGAHLGNL